ncbi:hypothetical protein EVC30_156 [Rhizobium phage RHph_Y1_11]|nr:hypothetical protein EVC30_156 [Rhizobium phage RHph_Y1_11]
MSKINLKPTPKAATTEAEASSEGTADTSLLLPEGSVETTDNSSSHDGGFALPSSGGVFTLNPDGTLSKE